LTVALGMAALFEIVNDGPFFTISADPAKATDWFPARGKASSVKTKRPLKDPSDPVKATFRAQLPLPGIVNGVFTEGVGRPQPLVAAVPTTKPVGGVMPLILRGVSTRF